MLQNAGLWRQNGRLGERGSNFFSPFLFFPLLFFFLSVPKLVSVHFCACCAWIKHWRRQRVGGREKPPNKISTVPHAQGRLAKRWAEFNSLYVGHISSTGWSLISVFSLLFLLGLFFSLNPVLFIFFPLEQWQLVAVGKGNLGRFPILTFNPKHNYTTCGPKAS